MVVHLCLPGCSRCKLTCCLDAGIPSNERTCYNQSRADCVHCRREMCTRTPLLTRLHARAHARTHARARTDAHTRAHTHTLTHTHTHIHTHTNTHTHTQTGTDARGVCTYTCVPAHTRTYTFPLPSFPQQALASDMVRQIQRSTTFYINSTAIGNVAQPTR
jgi:hypothetical protein